MLSLARNELTGGVPPGLGRLASLEELNLSHNAGLAGVLPASLTALGALRVLLVGGTDLCAPPDPGFTDWLGRLTRRRIAICGAGNIRRLSDAGRSVADVSGAARRG